METSSSFLEDAEIEFGAGPYIGGAGGDAASAAEELSRQAARRALEDSVAYMKALRRTEIRILQAEHDEYISKVTGADYKKGLARKTKSVTRIIHEMVVNTYSADARSVWEEIDAGDSERLKDFILKLVLVMVRRNQVLQNETAPHYRLLLEAAQAGRMDQVERVIFDCPSYRYLYTEIEAAFPSVKALVAVLRRRNEHEDGVTRVHNRRILDMENEISLLEAAAETGTAAHMEQVLLDDGGSGSDCVVCPVCGNGNDAGGWLITINRLREDAVTQENAGMTELTPETVKSVRGKTVLCSCGRLLVLPARFLRELTLRVKKMMSRNVLTNWQAQKGIQALDKPKGAFLQLIADDLRLDLQFVSEPRAKVDRVDMKETLNSLDQYIAAFQAKMARLRQEETYAEDAVERFFRYCEIVFAMARVTDYGYTRGQFLATLAENLGNGAISLEQLRERSLVPGMIRNKTLSPRLLNQIKAHPESELRGTLEESYLRWLTNTMAYIVHESYAKNKMLVNIKPDKVLEGYRGIYKGIMGMPPGKSSDIIAEVNDLAGSGAGLHQKEQVLFRKVMDMALWQTTGSTWGVFSGIPVKMMRFGEPDKYIAG